MSKVTASTKGGSGGALTVQDEGITQSTAVTTLNFVGAGVTASGAGAVETINIPGGGAPAMTEVEVDFGTKPTRDAQFNITDASVNASSKVQISESGKMATGRVATGDAQWDSISAAALPAAGSFIAFCVAHPGPVVGKRKLHYSVA